MSLLHSDAVKGVFQSHFGYISIDLKNGTTKWYNQDKMDWIIQYIRDNNLNEKLEYVAME